MEFDKSKVYTALNADESLIGAKGYFSNSLDYLKQSVLKEEEKWFNHVYKITETSIMDDYSFCKFDFFYLVEPAPEKPKYRPFKDCDELIEEFCKRFNVPRTAWGLPFIWIKSESGTRFMITEFLGQNRGVTLGSDKDSTRFDQLLNSFTFMDGSPIGIEE